MSLLANTLHVPGILRTLIRNVHKQERFLEKNLGPELAVARREKDNSLDETDFKKISRYYGLAVPAILGEALCVLRGHEMTEAERMACTYQGAATGLFDDFFDKHEMPDELLKTFIENPGSLSGSNSSEKLFLSLYRQARQYFSNQELTDRFLSKVYQAQVESRKQAIPGLSNDEIKRITVNKGGVSVLFYRSVFAHPLEKEEEEALYQIGGLMQFGNDIFDVYKDSQNNIDTLVTTATRVDDVRQQFSEMTRSGFTAFYQTPYSRKNIRKFLRLVSMSLCGRCHVCLDQLEKKESLSDHIFSPKKYSRKDLVCDMDKARNKWRSIIYFIKQDLPALP